jgi:hypothetical protein
MKRLALLQVIHTFTLASGQNGINLVNEDDARLGRLRHCEQGLHKLFALSNPLAGQTRCGNTEEGGLDVASNGFSNESFASSRRAKEQQTLWGCTRSCK